MGLLFPAVVAAQASWRRGSPPVTLTGMEPQATDGTRPSVRPGAPRNPRAVRPDPPVRWRSGCTLLDRCQRRAAEAIGAPHRLPNRGTARPGPPLSGPEAGSLLRRRPGGRRMAARQQQRHQWDRTPRRYRSRVRHHLAESAGGPRSSPIMHRRSFKPGTRDPRARAACRSILETSRPQHLRRRCDAVLPRRPFSRLLSL